MKSTKIIPSYNDKYCLVCFNKLKINNLHELVHNNIYICQKCLDDFSPKLIEGKVDGIKGLYIYTYNDKIKEKIYTLKGCGDIELAKTFLNYYLFELKLRYKGYIIVPSPSNEESNNDRGFNHVIEIFKPLKLPIISCIYKTVNFKQSDLSKIDREKVIKKLAIKDENKLTGKKVLFVDDISTSGSTLKACLKLIKKGRPRKLNFLIVAKV